MEGRRGEGICQTSVRLLRTRLDLLYNTATSCSSVTTCMIGRVRVRVVVRVREA